MRHPRRPRWGVALAFFCSLMGCLPSGSWALCVEANGHVALEIECRLLEPVPVSAPAAAAADGCRECRDYRLTTGVGVGLARPRLMPPLPPVVAAPASASVLVVPAPAIALPPVTPPDLARSCRQRPVLRI